MASRSKAPRRREPDSDSLEALKPLVVLGLLGMILYGAYSIVQKGPASPPPALPEAPPFTTSEAAFASPAAVTAPQVEVPPPVSTPPVPAVAPVAAVPATPPVSAAAPTYLNAQSAAPPQNADVAATDPALPSAAAVSAVPPAAVPLASSPGTNPLDPLPSAAADRSSAPPLPSAAFASAWADAHDKLAAGRYAEALAVLSAWHDDASLGLEESQRLEELLGQLAGTVIYSQQDLLLPPHVAAPGDTLDAIAAGHRVPWQLLAKINGIDDPKRLLPGEAIKLVRGPFDAVVSVSRRRLSLQVAGNYAGVFPVVIGRGVPERIGSSLAVSEVRRDAGLQPAGAAPTTAGAFVQQVAGQAGTKAIVLHEGLRIESAEDPAAMSDMAPAGALIVTPRDLDELIDILGEGSHVLIRQ